jgi:hypothetical protein
MALKGTFLADFASFYDAVTKAEQHLVDFSSGADRASARLDSMVDAFSGKAIIQQATLMAEAVERIGGVSKLTEAQLARVSATGKEAAEHLIAMGQRVPPGIQKIADASQATFSSFLAGIPVVGQFIAALSVERMFEFAKGAIEAASRIEDLSRATGLSATDIQKFGYVGVTFGVDLESMARGVEQLSARLAGGDKSATLAVQMLGLSVKDLIASGPREACLSAADAAGKLQNPMLEGAIATDLFGGKLAKILLPALGNLRTAMEQVPKDALISEANIKAANDFDAAIQHGEIHMKAWTTAAVLLPVHIFGFYRDMLKGVTEEFLDDTTSAHGFFNAQVQVGGVTDEVTEKARIMANALKAWRTEALEPLTDAQREGINVGLQYGKSEAEIASAIGASISAVHAYDAAQKALDDTILASWKAEAEAVKILEDVEIKLHKGALERFKTETDALRKMTAEKNAAVIEGQAQIQHAQDALADYIAKATLSSSDYQIREIWRVVAEEERAFKGSEQQRASYNKAVEALANQQADVIIAAARRAEAAALTLAIGGTGGFNTGQIPNTGSLHGVVGSTGPGPITIFPSFDTGGPVLRDGPIYAHAGEFVIPKGGGGGTTIINNYLNGSIRDLAQPLMDHIEKSIKQGRLLPSN